MGNLDLNFSSGKKSVIMNNQAAAEVQILFASPNSCPPKEKAVESMLSNLMHLVPMVQTIRKESTVGLNLAKIRLRWVYQRSYCLNRPVSGKGRLGKTKLQPLGKGDYRVNLNYQNVLKHTYQQK